jgi:hypothetical protein
MQRKKRMDVGATLEADLAASVVPGYEILDGPGVFPVYTENPIRVDDVTESPKLAE